MVLEVFSSFSSRPYPPVRKRTDHCGMNMSTNIALETRTRCYSFDQYVRKCNESLVVNMMAKKIIFPKRAVSTVLLLLCETSCPPQQQEQDLPAAVPGLATTDEKPHCCRCCWCCSPVLLLLWFGYTHAHKNCASDLWVEGTVYKPRRGTHQQAAQQAGPDIYRLAVTQLDSEKHN